MYKDRLAYTVSEERINIDMPMYINENNKISIVAEIGSLAGAESYYHIIELE